jgi:hypothetical protein
MWPLWTELCSEQNLYVESLIPNVTVFGARTYNEVKRVEWWQGLNQIEVVRGEDSRGLCLRVNRKKGPVSRRRQPLPASRDSTKTSPNTILTLHFLPPELWENECLWWKPIGQCYFVMAALEDKYHTHTLYFLFQIHYKLNIKWLKGIYESIQYV